MFKITNFLVCFSNFSSAFIYFISSAKRHYLQTFSPVTSKICLAILPLFPKTRLNFDVLCGTRQTRHIFPSNGITDMLSTLFELNNYLFAIPFCNKIIIIVENIVKI